MQNAYDKLGVTEDSTFEEIQNAKQRLGKEHRQDSQLVESIEAAYDEIIMDRLKKRQEGKIKVPDRIRYPEVQEPPSESPFKLNNPFSNSLPANSSGNWLQSLIDTPSQGDILLPTGIFSGLAVLSLVAAGTGDNSIIPLLLSFGFVVCIYLLNRKEKRFGRSFLLSLFGLFAGVGIGAGLYGLLEPQLLDANQFSAVVTFVFFWVISSFLR
jgi:hypothetical protein